MAKQDKAKSTEFVNLNKDQVTFDKPNTRFSGMDVLPSDPTPYKDIPKMFHSMVACYKSTGSLLLQPIGVELLDDGTYGVRLGFNRSMTFVTRYEDLCKACGVEELTLPAQVFEALDESESLMENIRRTDQHFMSIAYTIHALRQKGHSYKSLKDKLGIGSSKIKGLELLPDMNTRLQQMCHDGIISEKAAVVLAASNEYLQSAVADYIESQDIQKVESAKEAEIILTRSLPTLHHKTPSHAFTSLDGKQYPMIIDEEWVLVEGDLMNTIYVLDEKAEARRMIDYYKMIAEQVKVWDKERYKITCSEAYVKCEMGTHPSEIAVWSNDNGIGWLDFYVKSTELNKVKNPEAYLDDRKKQLEERANNKEVNIKAKAKLELMHELMDTLADSDIEGVDMLIHQVVILAYEKLNKAQAEKFDEYMGKAVQIKWNKHNLAEFDSRTLLVKMGMAIMHGEYSVYQGHRDFFAANDIDFNALYNEKYEAELKDEIEKARTQHKDLAIRAEDTLDDRQLFVQEMHELIILGTTQTLREHLGQNEAKEDKYIKYVAKGLGMTAKGGTEIVAFRLNNVANLLEETFEVTVNEKRTVLTELLERFDSIGMAFDEMHPDATVTKDFIESEYNSMFRAYCEITGHMDIDSRKVDFKPVLKACTSDEENKGDVLVREFITAYAAVINADFGYRFVYLKNGKKVSILG